MLKESIVKAYGKKGEKVVAQNHAAVDGSVSSIVKIDIPQDWADANDAPEGRLGTSHTPAAQAAAAKGPAHFLEEVVKPILAMEGDRLPVRWVATAAGSMAAAVMSETTCKKPRWQQPTYAAMGAVGLSVCGKHS